MDVVLVGAGAASLMAAKVLLEDTSCQSKIRSVTIVEALDYVGGRIKGVSIIDDSGNEHVLDLGAELVHGWKTSLSDLIEEYQEELQGALMQTGEPLMQDFFVTSHGDGGPQSEPTDDSHLVGCYYIGKEDLLLPYNTTDPDFLYLSRCISNMEEIAGLHEEKKQSEDHFDFLNNNEERKCLSTRNPYSIGQYLLEDCRVAIRMKGLLNASFSNTLGCADLCRVDLKRLNEMEEFWEQTEEEGDALLNSRIGMAGLIKILYQQLQKDSRFRIRLNYRVDTIYWNNHDKIRIVPESSTHEIFADKVIVTVPPPVITSSRLKFDPPLPDWKQNAFQAVGMESAIKISLRMKQRSWPAHIQSVISSEQPIPELWFRQISGEQNYLVVGFLTSKAADQLRNYLRDETQKNLDSDDNVTFDSHRVTQEKLVVDIVKKQLQCIFPNYTSSNVSDLEIESCFIEDWGKVDTILGGYSYPTIGCTKQKYDEMAQPVQQQLYFAGEATHTGATSTVQAALDTGNRAAHQVLSSVKS